MNKANKLIRSNSNLNEIFFDQFVFVYMKIIVDFIDF